ncbi:glycerate kinase [Winogradskyella sp. R77965]|uniref:glycerate kinase n=1 Tax=Winogradskyella sp. R77965 TaxID=3093872 RepID=UPI0037DC58BD
MKIVLAPDKYKGSLTGLEFCSIIEQILKLSLSAEVIKAPLADGGDGTIEVVNYYLKGNIIKVEVNNPVFKPVLASYLYSESSKIAFIEMAEASGMKLLKPEDQNCMHTTTFGTGQLVINAIDKGAKHIILGIGGSATNDCGIGMATALGYRFLDKNNKEVKPIGSELSSIIKIDDALVDKRLKNVKFQIACDVTNPLYGPNGAAFVYAKQKGATEDDISYLDQGLQSLSKVLDKHFNLQTQHIQGAGAAGGMGAGTVAFLTGELLPGIDVIKQIADFDTKIKNADWIITGEGNLDDQTLSGKALSGVLNSAKNNQIKVAAFCGSIDLGKRIIQDLGITYSDSIMNHALSLNDALMNAKQYLEIITKEFIKQKLR